MTTPLTNDQLIIELQRAYRCIQGMHNALTRGIECNFGYHALTIGAAKRYVFEGELDGSTYFEGKQVSVLHDALKLGSTQ